MEETVGSVQEEVGLLREEIKKILAIQQGITNLLNTMEQLLRAQGNQAREPNSKNQIDSPPADNSTELGGTSGRALEVRGVHESNAPWWDMQPRRIELSTFDGDNPKGWMLKVEHYFALHRMTNVEKLKTTNISFEGKALVWFKYENRAIVSFL